MAASDCSHVTNCSLTYNDTTLALALLHSSSWSEKELITSTIVSYCDISARSNLKWSTCSRSRVVRPSPLPSSLCLLRPCCSQHLLCSRCTIYFSYSLQKTHSKQRSFFLIDRHVFLGFIYKKHQHFSVFPLFFSSSYPVKKQLIVFPWSSLISQQCEGRPGKCIFLLLFLLTV